MEVTQLLQVLATGDFDPIVGVSESGTIDFKREPYQLNTEMARFELAKDVAAFANGFEEAIIVVGVETVQPEDAVT